MKLRHKLLSLSAALLMATTQAGAIIYSDLQGYGWASNYIYDVTNKQIIAGYPDKTFKPGNSVTRIESLVMMANLFPKADIDKIYAEKEPVYRESMIKNDIDKWARPYVIFALEKGIIPNTPEMIRALVDVKTKKPIIAMRYEVSVFLVRTLGLLNELNNSAKLDYKDTKDILTQAVPFIELLQRKGVLSKKGDGKGYFNPNKGITRAETAVMISNAYKYSPKAKGTSTVSPTTPTAPQVNTQVVEGTIQLITLADSNITISAKDSKGNTNNYTVNKNNLVVNLDGAQVNINNLKVGQTAKFTLTNGVLSKVDMTSVQERFSGKLLTLDSANKTMTLELADNKQIKAFLYNDTSKLYLNDKEVKPESLPLNNPIEVYAINNVIVKAAETQTIGNAQGEVLDFIDNLITVQTADGKKSYKINSNTKIIRNGRTLTNIYQIAIGDKANIKYNNDTAEEVSIETSREKYYGVVIKSIELNTGYNKILVGDRDGNEHSFTINSDSSIRINDKKSSVYDLKLGYEVDLYTDGGLVEELISKGEFKQATISGEIIFIDTIDKYIDITTSKGEKLRINYNNDTKTEKLSNSTSMDPRNLFKGDKISVIGVMNGGNLKATMIIADIK